MGTEKENRNETSSRSESWGWGVLRPPPVPAVLLGVVYGIIAGVAIVYAIVIALRLIKVGAPKIIARMPIIGSRS